MDTARIDSPAEAARLLRVGGLVAFPTETVFGLGVDATNDAAVRRLFAAKGRPGDNPLIVHVDAIEKCNQAAASVSEDAKALLEAFAPGPLTVVLPKGPAISPLVTAGLDTVGVRVPNHEAAREVLRRAGMPIAAPSANRSGRPSCTRWQSVLEDLDGVIDAVYCDNSPGLGVESTVVDCSAEVAVVLRPGAVSIEQIREVLPNAIDRSARGVTTSGSSTLTRSPGLLHPHYQPRAEVKLIDRPNQIPEPTAGRVAYCGLDACTDLDRFTPVALYDSVEEYAANFYEFLREADRQAAQTIWVQAAPAHGIGLALLDRQRRAAGL